MREEAFVGAAARGDFAKVTAEGWRARAEEEERLTKDLQAAEEKIKALADALVEHGRHPDDCSAWLANGDFDEAECSCGIAAALRLAGRLP